MEIQHKSFYSPQEVADLLGVKVLTVYRWIKDGKLNAVKIGQWRIFDNEMQRLLKEGQRK